METSLVAIFLKEGVVGAAIIVLAIVVWKLYRAYTKTQETRVAEAQAVTAQILTLSREWIETLNKLSRMLERYTDGVSSLRSESHEKMAALGSQIQAMIEKFSAYAEELRRRSGRRGED